MTLQIPNHSGTHIWKSFKFQTLRDKMRMSIPHSPTGFKREMRFLGIVRGRGGVTRDERRETRTETIRRKTIRRCGLANVSSSHVSARLSSRVSRQRAHARIASGRCGRGETDEPVRKPLVQVMFAFVRRQDGGSPCGGRGAAALPSVAASCAPPMGTIVKGQSRSDSTSLQFRCVLASVHHLVRWVLAVRLRFPEASDVSLLFALRGLRRACIV